jgi:hypothetical protein
MRSVMRSATLVAITSTPPTRGDLAAAAKTRLTKSALVYEIIQQGAILLKT